MQKNIEEAKKWLRRAAEAGSQEAVEKLKMLEAQEGYKSERFGLVKVGSIIKFGSYPQNSNDKKEPIEWRVLDVKDDTILLISQYALECKPYNIIWKDTSWQKCTLREWLNNDFLNSAFEATEKNVIKLSKVTADNNPRYSTNQGNDTEDKVFLLSVKEADRYFKSDDDRKCAPTKLAVSNRVYKNANGHCWWWLRSLGIDSHGATSVNTDGSVRYGGHGVDDLYGPVRPALWINLKS